MLDARRTRKKDSFQSTVNLFVSVVAAANTQKRQQQQTIQYFNNYYHFGSFANSSGKFAKGKSSAFDRLFRWKLANHRTYERHEDPSRGPLFNKSQFPFNAELNHDVGFAGENFSNY